MAHPHLPDRSEPERVMLICRVGPHLCAIPLDQVVEIMRPLPAEPLARMPAFVRGLALIRGAPTPVVDARALLGARPEGEPGRVVTLRTGRRAVALAVDETLGIRTLPAVRFDDLPPLMQVASSGMVSAVGALDTELLLVLQSSRIVPDAVWQVLEAVGQP